ncbi:HIT family protein [archaeon]|jgi:histidine triad (HIT) family protein|nr:HIT family protein [archaeon]MBT3577586.1 HIT family protein [archaeon]MBT6820134.1 HIT family protein [archaeon]MBT6956210.1 HIT family protein [archaeon]MBT7025708.1 HIT family protein [archaeon]
MALTDEQVRQVKDQLLEQLDNFPEDKRAQIKEQIDSMNPDQVEEFVKQNQLSHMPGGDCVFCSIIEGKMPSIKIAENEENIAILEINPINKGHTLIVPREHLDKVKDSTNALADQVSKRITEKFNPVEIRINEKEIMGHQMLEVVPVYTGDEGKPMERAKASEEELKKVQEELSSAESTATPTAEPETAEPETPEEPEELPKLKPRIP